MVLLPAIVDASGNISTNATNAVTTAPTNSTLLKDNDITCTTNVVAKDVTNAGISCKSVLGDASSTSVIDNDVPINNDVAKQPDSALHTTGVIDGITLQQQERLLFDINQIDPSMLYINEKDKLMLQPLPELERELILAWHIENIKKVEEMKIALAEAFRHHEEKESRCQRYKYFTVCYFKAGR